MDRSVPLSPPDHKFNCTVQLVEGWGSTVSTLRQTPLQRPILTVAIEGASRRARREFKLCIKVFDHTYAGERYDASSSTCIHGLDQDLRTFPTIIAITVDTCNFGWADFGSTFETCIDRGGSTYEEDMREQVGSDEHNQWYMNPHLRVRIHQPLCAEAPWEACSLRQSQDGGAGCVAAVIP
jgi:hypothetical protein